MRTPKGRCASVRSAVVLLLLALGAVSVLPAVPAAHAASTTISITTSNGSTVCPSLGGAWDAGTDTCWFSSWLTISSTTILNISAGVTVDGGASIANSGTINNEGTINGYGGTGGTGDFCRDGGTGGTGIANSGTINNYGTITGSGGTGGTGGYCVQFGANGGTGGDGINNGGTINNDGTIAGGGGTGGAAGMGIPTLEPGEPGSDGNGGTGIANTGTINNKGTIRGGGGDGGNGDNPGIGGPGIANAGTINNEGTIKGNGGGGGPSGSTGGGWGGTGIANADLINDYCGVTLSSYPSSYSSYAGNPPDPISCYTITFDQSGIPTSWVVWGVTLVWGPFVLPMDHTGTGSSISVQAVGSLTYSYDTPVKFTGTIYDCTAGCSGTSPVSGAASFSASYANSGSYEVVTSTTAVTCSPGSVLVGSSTSCTATVTGSSPTGAVMFSTFVGAMSQFSSTTCALTSGTCHVNYTPASSTSPVTIMATYEGDSNNSVSSGTFSLTVTGPPPTITTSNGSTVCPFLGGAWDNGTDSCWFSSGLTINSTMALDVGAGVTVHGYGSLDGIRNEGTINNDGTITGGGSTGVANYGTINNYGTITGNGLTGVNGEHGNGIGHCYGGGGGNGIVNYGTINNEGTITGNGGQGGNGCSYQQGRYKEGGQGGPGGVGISNPGTINNKGTITGNGGTGGRGGYGDNGIGGNGNVGIYDTGTINNNGTITGSGGPGGPGENSDWGGSSGTGIYNPALIIDYCGVTLSYSSYVGYPPNTISCYPVTFDQSGIPSGVTWGVTLSWGPFVLPQNYTGSGTNVTVQIAGSLTYSYGTPITSSGTTYHCRLGCSGTAIVSNATTFFASYLLPLPPPPPTGAEICQGQAPGRCFTSFIAFRVTSGGNIVDANVTIVRQHGPTQNGTTEVGNPLQMAWYDVSILDTITYTVTLSNGHTITGTASNPNPWTVMVVNVSG